VTGRPEPGFTLPGSLAVTPPGPGEPGPGPGPLVPARLRRTAVALLVVCVAVVTVPGVLFAGQSRPDGFDAPIDAAFVSGLGAHPAVLGFLAEFGDPLLVTVMTTALVLGCAVARRWRGAALAAVAVPVASSLTEGLLKPGIGRTHRGGFSYPSGHATSSFALATVSIILLAAPSWPRVPAITRRLLMLGAVLLAVAVASAVVGLNLHYFTDIVGGAALGTGTAVLTALLLDIVCGSEWWRARTARPSPGRLTPGPGPFSRSRPRSPT
jgi:PAP2 superfamily